MSLTTLVPPAGEPVALAAGKAHLRIDYAGEDDLVASLIAAARCHIETKTGLRLMRRTFEWRLNAWPLEWERCAGVSFPVGPIASLEDVMIDGLDVTDDFMLMDSVQGRFLMAKNGRWPTIGSQAIIRFVAGLGDLSEEMPEDLVQAIKLQMSVMYGRDTDVSLAEVETLIAPYRRVAL